MRKILASIVAVAAVLLIVAGVYLARATDRTGPPSGIAADRWMPIGDDLGVALDSITSLPGHPSRQPPPDARTLPSILGAEGRLFARVNGVWMPVYLKARPEGIQPAR